MFVDRIQIRATAGKGGNGVIAWRREKYLPKGGPYGGGGGFGGDVILEATENLYSLEDFRPFSHLKAENGRSGGTSLQQGRRGRNLVLKVPCGTRIIDAKTNALIDDLTEAGQKHILCHGGRGGRGNASFATSRRRAPNICTEGKPGESCEVVLELKIIADVGLVGLPNAGKSSLLAALTSAAPKVGAYPFTTLAPNLGEVIFDDYQRIRIADVPGIIHEASNNRGLGLEFLRHIERTKALVFVLDASDKPERALELLRTELSSYNKELLQKPSLILLNKCDIEEATTALPTDETLCISALEKSGLETLKERLYALLQLGCKPAFL